MQELLGKIQPEVVFHRFDASETIEKVWVSPYAQLWYQEVVRTVLDKFAPDLASRLVWSEMRADPLF